MPYKVILVQTDQSSNYAERVRLAVQLAQQHDAHLAGTAVTGGISMFAYPGAYSAESAGYSTFITAQMDMLRKQAEQATAEFESVAGPANLRSHEGVVIDDEAGNALSLRARYSDLLMIGQTKLGEARISVPPDLPEYLLMGCGRPVLLIPFAGSFATLGRRPMVAWDGGLAAARAVTGAMPILELAEQVDVVVFMGDTGDVCGEQPGDDVALFLARHGVTANVIRSESGIDNGHTLVSLARDRGADLIVMGGYGHTRLREFVMGGVTRTMLHAMNLPVLMAH